MFTVMTEFGENATQVLATQHRSRNTDDRANRARIDIRGVRVLPLNQFMIEFRPRFGGCDDDEFLVRGIGGDFPGERRAFAAGQQQHRAAKQRIARTIGARRE